jgi:hypothetical protein
VDEMTYKTDCRECKWCFYIGLFKKPNCLVMKTDDELYDWLMEFINERGCISFEKED